jgi:hypothetical protein
MDQLHNEHQHHDTVVVTHPGRCVGVPYLPVPAKFRWSGAHINRAHDDALARQCPLMFWVPGYGLVDDEPVQHVWRRTVDRHVDLASWWLVNHKVQQVIAHTSGGEKSTGFEPALREIVRRAVRDGVGVGVAPRLYIYGPQEGVADAL